MSGAARLAAYAALSAGAGRTLITLLDPAGPAHDTAHPEWIWHPLAALNSPGALERATLVCGCGAGMALDERLASWLERAPRLVLDADALNAIARDRALGDALQARSPRGQHSILTPHPLEAARLLGVNTSAVQSDRVACAHRLAETFGTTVALKGSGTVIATPGETTAINATGGPALASGGSGDVLAGWIGGLWAQAHSGHEDLGGSAVAHKVACSAAWLHGHAADLQRPRATLTATELVQAMRSVPTPSGIASAH
jgi:hydroxyethylthiazole kinase-like uncharacterized protein yjeF